MPSPETAPKTAGRVVAGVELLTAKELAAQIGCSLSTRHRIRRSGKLKPTYVAGRCFFTAGEVRRWLRSLTGEAYPLARARSLASADGHGKPQ